MTIDLTRLTANTQTWAHTASTANVSVPLSDGGPRTLTGMAAAAYLFGQALTTVKYQDTLDGVQLSDCRFQFPPAAAPTSGPDTRQWVTLSEVADALRYKYGVDPLIEFAPGLGLRGYSVPDINRILELLNREFADSFNIALTVSSTAVEVATTATFDLEKAAASVSSTDTTADFVIFTTDPNWVTGTPVRVSSPSGGLTNFANNFYVDYFVRNLGEGKYSFFNSQAEAVGTATTGRVDLTSAIGSGVTISYSAPSINATNVGDEWVSFGTDPNWATGTPVRVGGLDAGVDYFVRNIGEGKYSFFTSQAAAAGTTTTGRVDLSGNLGYEQVSVSYVPTIVSTLLNTASTPILAGATEIELRQNLTEGGDLYTDRFGAFYLNGVRTQAMDVAVTSRLLVQDNVSAEYKTLMDELAERNNLIAAARVVNDQISSSATGQTVAQRNASLLTTVKSLESQYGDDILTDLTAGAFQHLRIAPSIPAAALTYLDTVKTNAIALKDFYIARRADAVARRDGYEAARARLPGLLFSPSLDVSNFTTLRNQASALITTYDGWLTQIDAGISSATQLKTAALDTADPVSAMNTALAQLRTTNGVTDVFAWIKKFDVPAGNLWDSRQDIIFYGFNGGVNPAAAPTARNINWSDRTSSSTMLGIDVTELALTTGISVYGFPAISRRIFTAEAAGVYGEFDWAEWQAGIERTEPSDSGTWSSIYSRTGLTINDEQWIFPATSSLGIYGGAQVGYTDSTLGIQASEILWNGTSDPAVALTAAELAQITALLNTLISNKVRDGDLDQAKLQTLTAQLQNNTEAMTALIKAFTDMNAQLARAL